MTARLFVSTYAKYNAGNLTGAWLDLDDYKDKDEFIAACLELHEDEQDPELMFQDYEGFPEAFYHESEIDGDVFDYLASNIEDEVKEAYMHLNGTWNEGDCQETYIGKFDSPSDMAQELLESRGMLEEVPEFLRNHIDFDSYANDMRCGGEYAEHEDHYFWNR